MRNARYPVVMLVRRIFYRWQFIAIIAVPAWLFIGQIIFGESAWGVIGMLVAAPVTFIALGIIALLVSMRPTVRSERAVSWIDVGVLGAWHAAIIAAGFAGPGSATFALLALALALAAFWVSVWQLVRDGARRMSATMSEYERAAHDAAGAASGASAHSHTQAPHGQTRGATKPRTEGDDDVIIIHERRD